MRVDKPLQERLNCSGHKEFRSEFMWSAYTKIAKNIAKCAADCKYSYNLASRVPADKTVKLWNSLMQTRYAGSPMSK